MPISDKILFIIGTIVVVFAAYYVTCFVGKKSARTGKVRAGGSIRLRDRFAVSKDKSLYLLEVKGKVYLVAMTNQSVTLLDTLDAQEFAQEDEEENTFAGAAAWSGVMNGAVNGVVKGFSALRDSLGRRRSGASKKTRVLQIAEEEDNLDRVYREMQTRRADRRQSSSREDGE